MIEQTEMAATRSAVSTWASREIRMLALVAVAANMLIPAAMYCLAIVTGEAYWRMFRGQAHAVDWFSSLQMLLIALVAYANYQLAGVACRVGRSRVPRHRIMWAVFAVGFVVLALDERFSFHEALRDRVFRPSSLFTDVDWMISGDVGLYLFLLIGIACSLFLLDDLRQARHAMVLFIAALVVAFPTFVIDSMRDSAMAGWAWRRFLDYTFEEVGEIWAQLLFLLSFLRVLAWRAQDVGQHDDGAP